MTHSDDETRIDATADPSAAGFYSDVDPNGRHFRLFANGTADGWAASVLDLDSQAWINEDIWAATADEVKTMVADFLRSILHYIGPVDWRRK